MSAYQPRRDPTAVVGRRIGAYLVDGLIGLVTSLIAFFILAKHFGEGDTPDLSEQTIARIVNTFTGTQSFEAQWNFGQQMGGLATTDDFWFVEGATFWLVNLVSFGVAIAMFVVLQGTRGTTPGKSLFKLRTVDEAGQPPGFGKALVRWLLLFVDSFLILPGLITSLVSQGHRRIGDMAASTYVVDAGAAGQPVVLPGAAPPYATGAMSATGPGPGPSLSPSPSPDAPDQPRWDPARNAYIRWDASQRAWLQWSDAEQRWDRIPS